MLKAYSKVLVFLIARSRCLFISYQLISSNQIALFDPPAEKVSIFVVFY